MIRTLAVENYRSLRRLIVPRRAACGQTEVAGREGPLDEPLWHWPKR
ncbi:hypothetical protein [Streptomyces sp. NPDC059861]